MKHCKGTVLMSQTQKLQLKKLRHLLRATVMEDLRGLAKDKLPLKKNVKNLLWVVYGPLLLCTI